MLNRNSFRFTVFRNQKRDAQSDLQRAEMVADAVTKALLSIDIEVAGLMRRVDELRAWVGGLLDSDNGGGDQRSRSAEADLIAAEGHLVRGVERLEYLRNRQIFYGDLKTTIESARAIEVDRAKI